jgi:hypothetical protein
MKTPLKIDLKNLDRIDNLKFLRMLDSARWSKLINTIKDPSNTKSLEELFTELVESGV